MEYQKHYDALVERAKDRVLSGYKERHHIIPKCMGGPNKKENLVYLTAREHFVAHQLLVKIYRNNLKLVHAAFMMTVSSETVIRNNRKYEWLRKKQSMAAKSRVGSKNGSFGKNWYHNPNTLESGKFENAPKGWKRGRTPNSKCEICDLDTGSKQRRFCKQHKPKSKSPTEKGYKLTKEAKDKIRSYCLNRSKEEHPQYGKRWINDSMKNIMINKEDLNQYLNNGWKRGKCARN